MKNKNNSCYNGEKGTVNVHCRFSKTQFERLRFLAEQNNYSTVSQYIRAQTLNPLAEKKMDDILNKLNDILPKCKDS